MDKKRNIKDFLLKHRARVAPEEYGFSTVNRRVPGLRREEVAQLASISVSWYTWLEQGRDISVSHEAIKRIGKVLKLSQDEQEYFDILVFGQAKPTLIMQEISSDLKSIIDAFSPNPAFIRRENMDIVYWNEAALSKIFDWQRIPETDRNSLKLMFLSEEYQARIPNWQEAARSTIASFRSYYAASSHKENFKPIIDDLTQRSSLFCEMWQDYEVRKIAQGEKSIIDSEGHLRHYRYSALKPVNIDDVFLIFYNQQSLINGS